MRRVVLLLAICAGASHANTKELQHNLEPKSDWITDTRKDDKSNIIEFQSKYTDQKSGISAIYVTPFKYDQSVFLDDKNNCKINHLRFEFNISRFSENEVDLSSGKIWVGVLLQYSLDRLNYDDQTYYLNVDSKDFLPYLQNEKNIKITFDKTKNPFTPFKLILMPFKGAKSQQQVTENECVKQLQIEKTKIYEAKVKKEKDEAEARARREKAEAQAKAYRDKQIEEVNRRNEEVMKRVNAQMIKPDVKIGMTRQQVVKNTRWGAPLRVNTTVTKYGTSEQWVYWGYKYLYFENGQLAIIQK